jgi:hypothetical protein
MVTMNLLFSKIYVAKLNLHRENQSEYQIMLIGMAPVVFPRSVSFCSSIFHMKFTKGELQVQFMEDIGLITWNDWRAK